MTYAQQVFKIIDFLEIFERCEYLPTLSHLYIHVRLYTVNDIIWYTLKQGQINALFKTSWTILFEHNWKHFDTLDVKIYSVVLKYWKYVLKCVYLSIYIRMYEARYHTPSLTHYSLVTQYGDLDLGQYCLRIWLGACLTAPSRCQRCLSRLVPRSRARRHQAISWTNVVDKRSLASFVAQFHGNCERT